MTEPGRALTLCCKFGHGTEHSFGSMALCSHRDAVTNDVILAARIIVHVSLGSPMERIQIAEAHRIKNTEE